MRLRLTVAYVGTRYSGWQIQERPDAPPTIQGLLEAVFTQVLCAPVRVHGAGRTDAGVHADGQVAHVDVPDARAGLDWLRICNGRLPEDVRVMDVRPVPPDFHARFSARGKIYTYQLWQEQRCMPPRLAPFAWNCGFRLDWDAVAHALPYFLGTHDFASFQNTGTDIQNTERTLRRLELRPDLALLPQADAMAIQVEGDGFLKQMVRNLVGVLVAVGRGKCAPEAIPELLALRSRAALSHFATAPAHGLTMTRVLYGEDVPAMEKK